MRITLGLIAAAALLAGCGADGSSGSGGDAQPPWYDGVQPGASAAKLGAADTPCPLPVAIDIPDKWKAKAYTHGDVQEGDLELKCEVDGKPASVIGFLRVFVGTGARDHRQTLAAFVTDQHEASDVQYRDTDVGPGKGLEATWRSPDVGPRRAFVTTTRTSTIVITVGGLDEEEHRNMLKAYLLAKQTLAPLEG